ncbi:hypothetical protein PSOLE_38540 [Pseudomonas oleovorans subsp. oleovorans]|jgi:hypothetical protein|uniref:Uncharacterized protein n=1 Tax=Ectopseudomonas oleovorans TaxID=301 RepID=A0A379PJ15_ECTOL|nr:hypothetical protein [Pseudomonas oleovorans]HBO7922127.1 hypothetical protein [Pseudomonas aeruginosa]OWK40034.1 hypothetical protein PSOLE_38540 [Pseudomonas oleovorans subsp. oleovorans]SEJ97146.1 hypothetical protein SAMN05216280_107513 [Pseudomonas oleovorans]SUE72627.1 Uncharacterised protein [Pseudomonas oleovorans]HBP6378514.1 hypothetical protein [Pseudomonas aeruginosa]
MRIARYTIHAVNDLHVIITDDLDEDMPSVTNSAAGVIEDLNGKLGGLGRRRVFYRDSVNRFDELRHENGIFTGFAPASPSQQEAFRDLI